MSFLKKRTASISPTNGLDFRPGRFSLDPSRAIEGSNYIYKDGQVRKRDAYVNTLTVSPTRYRPVGFDGAVKDEYLMNDSNKDGSGSVRINGIWDFVAEDGENHVVAHIGRLLYEITGFGTDDMDAEPLSFGNAYTTYGGRRYVHCYEFEDYKSSAFVGANRLWFLGGNKFMCLRFTESGFDLSPVENGRDTYVPTTTVNITYEYARSSGRASLDAVNLLSDWRKNRLLSGVGYPDSGTLVNKNYRYVLDAPIVCRKRTDMADFRMTLTERSDD